MPTVEDDRMGWHLTADVDEFWAAAGTFLRSRPVENTLALSLVDTLRTRDRHFYGADDPVCGWYAADGAVLGAVLQTPPRPLIIVGAPADAVPGLADLLADRPVPGVNGPAPSAAAFAAAWQRLTGATATVSKHTRLFRLHELVEPAPPPPGRARIAQVPDRDLLVSWTSAFNTELGEPDIDAARDVDDRLSYGGLTLWEVSGGPLSLPVSLAGATRSEAGVARVAPVYTPRQHRGRGFASAVTSAVTRRLLDGGAGDVVLFTDVANPTSNGVYERLGFRPVEDRVVMEFTA